MLGVADSVICDAALRIIIGPDFLRPVPGFDLAASLRRDGRVVQVAMAAGLGAIGVVAGRAGESIGGASRGGLVGGEGRVRGQQGL